jgi:hypothetical protein
MVCGAYLLGMKQITAYLLAFGLVVTPALAQEEATPEIDEGFSLMEEGARLLMRGLLEEMEPAIEGLQDGLADLGPALTEFMAAAGPALADLLNQVDDFRNYDAPEFLPNGDIIIRRSPDAPAWEPDPENGDIEL